MPLSFDFFPPRLEVDLALPVATLLADDRLVLPVLAEADFAEPDLDDVDLELDFAAPDRDALDLAELDFADADFAEPDLAAEVLVALVPLLEAPLVDLDLDDAVERDVALFFADPPAFDVDDFAVEDLAPTERPDILDFAPDDFDAVDLDAPDFDEARFAVELVDFLVVAMFGSSTLQIGFRKYVRSSAIDVPDGRGGKLCNFTNQTRADLIRLLRRIEGFRSSSRLARRWVLR